MGVLGPGLIVSGGVEMNGLCLSWGWPPGPGLEPKDGRAGVDCHHPLSNDLGQDHLPSESHPTCEGTWATRASGIFQFLGTAWARSVPSHTGLLET